MVAAAIAVATLYVTCAAESILPDEATIHVKAFNREGEDIRYVLSEVSDNAGDDIGVPVEDCLIFEDSESGIRNAFQAGCRNVIVVDSMGVAEKYANQRGIVKIIHTFEEIL